MFLRKIVDFFGGYVIISLKGFYIERFINICVRRGIHIWSIKRSSKNFALARISVSDFRRIRPVARKTHTKLHILKKCGFPVLLYRYRKRYVLFAGIIVLLAFMVYMSGYIWIIEVSGTESVSEDIIMRAAVDAGVFEGAKKRDLKDIQKVRDIILSRVDDLAWAWVYIEGSKATIEVREKILPPEVVDKNLPCNVVAMRDGLIKKITVKQGVTDLKEGDAVLAGEVVISGTVMNKDMTNFRYVHALGTVEALTWHEKKGTYKLYDEIRVPTGRKVSRHTLDLFSKKFSLFFDDSIDYSDYDKTEKKTQLKFGKNNYVGIGMETVTYEEVTVAREELPIETVVERAKNALEEAAAKELIAGAKLVDSKLDYRQTDSQTVEVTVTMEFVEKIGTEKQISIEN